MRPPKRLKLPFVALSNKDRLVDANGLTDTLARLGLTQAAAGELLGVEQSTISRWLNGERSIPPPVVKLLLLVEHIGLKRARRVVG